ncbi:TPA: hypothetical protein R2K51_002128 [Raoultella ornithinolytica]|nr:hypothetical protein [Raoultella ornithinolytica]
MKIPFVDARPGSGKTTHMRDLIQNHICEYRQGGKCLIVVQETKKLLHQTLKDIQPAIIITSSDDLQYSESLEQRIIDAIKSKVVIGITDKMFFRLNPTIYKNHKCLIDDVTTCWISMMIFVKTGSNWNVAMNSICPVPVLGVQNTNSNNIEVKLNLDACIDTDDRLDTLLKRDLAGLKHCDHVIIHKSFLNPENSIEQFIGEEQDKSKKPKMVQLQILGYNDLARYRELDIVFFANNFTNSLIYKCSPELFEPYTGFDFSSMAPVIDNRLKIVYVSERELTSTYAQSPQGKDDIEKFRKYCLNNIQGDYFWAANDIIVDGGFSLPGKRISTTSRGINDYKHIRQAVWCSSLKPSPQEVGMVQQQFGISRTEITYWREIEAIVQFMFRGVLRDKNSTEKMILYVFDKKQAESLSLYSTDIEFKNIGISKSSGKAIGRPAGSSIMTPDEAELSTKFRKYLSKNSGDNSDRVTAWICKEHKMSGETRKLTTREKYFLEKIRAKKGR